MIDQVTLAETLRQKGEPFVLATVVRAESPTSAKAGDKAIITAGGIVAGWVGGSCAEPTAIKMARAALDDGACRLVQISPDAAAEDSRGGLTVVPMTCYSGGTIEIYLEPHLPAPQLIVFGNSPVAFALCELGLVQKFRVTAVDLTERPRMDLSVPVVRAMDQVSAVRSAPTYVVVATHGVFDEEAIERALQLNPDYLGLVASRRRGSGVLQDLVARGVSAVELARVLAPAGLELNAATPEEIALSIIAQIVQVRRGARLEQRAHAAKQAVQEVVGAAAPASDPKAESCCSKSAGITTDEARVVAVLLAAGESRRMGKTNKLLLPIDGTPLVRRTAETLLASGLTEVLVVVGHEAHRVKEALAGLAVRFVINEDYQAGQETSVRVGLGALPAGADGAMICLGDQPALTAADVREIAGAFRNRTDGSVLVPMFRGRRGNPIVIDRSALEEILARGGKFACRQFTDKNDDLVERYEMPNDHILVDVDRPEDYEAVHGAGVGLSRKP